MYFSFIEDSARARYRFQTAPPVRDFANVAVGVVWVLPYGLSAFTDYRALVGHSERRGHTFSVGLRVGF